MLQHGLKPLPRLRLGAKVRGCVAEDQPVRELAAHGAPSPPDVTAPLALALLGTFEPPLIDSGRDRRVVRGSELRHLSSYLFLVVSCLYLPSSGIMFFFTPCHLLPLLLDGRNVQLAPVT